MLKPIVKSPSDILFNVHLIFSAFEVIFLENKILVNIDKIIITIDATTIDIKSLVLIFINVDTSLSTPTTAIILPAEFFIGA
ncbi:hypothetical protein SDC9_154214 [bioreactor metagenome]|uniref:Uncharacterized protein n=1 Tax=bioreactor metagenome TaxID=1076179 RepID=A0A645EYF6_9ZZZZ